MNKTLSLSLLLLFVALQGLYSQVCFPTCKDSLIVSLDSNCKASIGLSDLLALTNTCQDLDYFVKDAFGLDHSSEFDSKDLFKQFYVKVSNTTEPSNFCNLKILVVDSIPPSVAIQDTFYNCIDISLANAFVAPQPVILDNCNTQFETKYIDQLWSLSCAKPWAPYYFEGSNWTQEGNCNSSNWSLVEDTLSTTGVSSICKERIWISIPVKGTFAGRWNLETTDSTLMLFLKLPGQISQLNLDTTQGSIFVPSLFKGDTIGFWIESEQVGFAFKFTFFDIKFVSDYAGVLIRKWTIKDESGNETSLDQHIDIVRNDIIDVFFPNDFIGTNSLNCEQIPDPQLTGYPHANLKVLSTTLQLHPLLPIETLCTITNYTDSLVSLCGGSKRIYREWRIENTCTGLIYNKLQIIELIDKSKPTIEPLQAVVLNAPADKCSFNFNIPYPIGNDECSPIGLSWSVSGNYGIGFGAFDFPVGIHNLQYVLSDACGNAATYKYTFQVKDITAPTVIAKSNTEYQLDSKGKVTVSANSFDLGSTDACCIKGFEVKPILNGVWSNIIVFDCQDLGVQTLLFKVTDCNGNFTTKSIDIKIVDSSVPVVICPADVTINCLQSVNPSNYYGQPIVSDNCIFQVSYNQTGTLDACGLGILSRSWKISNTSTWQSLCQQKITRIAGNPWNGDGKSIVWPIDFTLNACADESALQPSKLPVGVAQPFLSSPTNCTAIVVDFTDELINSSGAFCRKYKRNWVVIDHCQFDKNPNTGRWTHGQFLNLEDKQAPILVVPDQLNFTVGNNCKATINFMPISVNDCDANVMITNSLNGGGAQVQDLLIPGNYVVSFTAKDACGNMSIAQTKLEVKDNTPPLLICKANHSATLNMNGTVEVVQNNLILTLSDNCASNAQMQLDMPLMKYNCATIGSHIVTIKATDQYGNSSICNVNIDVSDPVGACNPADCKIAGRILNPKGLGVNGVTVALNGNLSGVETTDNIGIYDWDGIPAFWQGSIRPEKKTGHLNGVTTFDLLQLNQHILGKKPFTSAYQYVAGDANHNKIVSTSDYVIIQNLILLNISELPGGFSWRFLPKSYVFANTFPKVPLFPETILLDGTQTCQSDSLNFIGVKLGDINGNADPQKLNAENETRSSELHNLSFIKKKSNQDGSNDYGLILNDAANIEALQFQLEGLQSISMDQIEFNSEYGLSTSSINSEYLKDGIIRMSEVFKSVSSNDTLLILKGINDISGIRLNLENFKAEWYRTDEIGSVELTQNTENKFYQIYPNPASDYIVIRPSTSMSGELTVTIFGLDGRAIDVKKFISPSGQLSMGLPENLVSGIYNIQIVQNSELINYPLVVVR